MRTLGILLAILLVSSRAIAGIEVVYPSCKADWELYARAVLAEPKANQCLAGSKVPTEVCPLAGQVVGGLGVRSLNQKPYDIS
ncbi:hypothetical protein CL631_00560 [bacterium]|jgi:hypothetical protein|nr:hypothetical protein [bacterium]|tara:strand:+ start:17456 stop:17704 length:249 start_codon:yes stop_codon:yes gene_type:complete